MLGWGSNFFGEGEFLVRKFFLFFLFLFLFLFSPVFALTDNEKLESANLYHLVQASNEEKGVGASGISRGRYGFAITTSVLIGLGLGNFIEGDLGGFSTFAALDLFSLGGAISLYFVARDTGDLPTDKIKYYDANSRKNKIAKDIWIASMAFFGFYGMLRIIQIAFVVANPYLGAVKYSPRIRGGMVDKADYEKSKERFVLTRLPSFLASSKGAGLGYEYKF